MVVLVLVLGLEVLMNHIGLYDEDNMCSSIGSFDGMTYKKHVGSLPENIVNKRLDANMVGS